MTSGWAKTIRRSLMQAGVDVDALPRAPDHLSHRCGHSYPSRTTLLFHLTDEEWALVAADVQRSLCYDCHMEVVAEQRRELDAQEPKPLPGQ